MMLASATVPVHLRQADVHICDWRLQLTPAHIIHLNEGYGHPLRPEYLLTPAGEAQGEPASEIMLHLKQRDFVDVGLRKWTIPVAMAILQVGGQFNRLLGSLDGITPRALSHTLVDLTEAGWVSRSLNAGHPPRSEYQLLPAPRPIIDAAFELERRLTTHRTEEPQ